MVGSTEHTFEMTMKLGNSAFDAEARPTEIARILRDAADKIEGGADFGHLFDINGNAVGTWEFDPAEPEPEPCCSDPDPDENGQCVNCGTDIDE